MSTANSIVTLTGANGTFTTTADANGAYSVSVPVGTYVMTVSVPNENGFVKVFSRAVVTDIDQNGATILTPAIPDIDSDSTTDAVVDVYFNKNVSVGIQTPVSTISEITNDRTDGNGKGGWNVLCVLTPDMFNFTTNEVTPVLQKVKITQLPQEGLLMYNGVPVTAGDELLVVTSTTFFGSLTYMSNTDKVTAYDAIFYYTVKTVASTNFG